MQNIDIIIPAYNVASCIENCLQSIFSQSGFDDIICNVIVVNDGSSDSTKQVVNSIRHNKLRTIDLPRNQGRSAAINAGIAASNAAYLIILDADCVWTSKQCLTRVKSACRNSDIKLLFGRTKAQGRSFWARYINQTADRRHIARSVKNQTTNNILIEKKLLMDVGGFPKEYRYYGFEDKDLMCTLAKVLTSEQTAYLGEWEATHTVKGMSVLNLCEKFYDAGRYSSVTYRSRHRDAYQNSPYARFDAAETSKYVKLILCCLLPSLSSLQKLAEYLTRNAGQRSFSLTLAVVRICLSLSFFKGSLDRRQEVLQQDTSNKL